MQHVLSYPNVCYTLWLNWVFLLSFLNSWIIFSLQNCPSKISTKQKSNRQKKPDSPKRDRDALVLRSEEKIFLGLHSSAQGSLAPAFPTRRKIVRSIILGACTSKRWFPGHGLIQTCLLKLASFFFVLFFVTDLHFKCAKERIDNSKISKDHALKKW